MLTETSLGQFAKRCRRESVPRRNQIRCVMVAGSLPCQPNILSSAAGNLYQKALPAPGESGSSLRLTLTKERANSILYNLVCRKCAVRFEPTNAVPANMLDVLSGL